MTPPKATRYAAQQQSTAVTRVVENYSMSTPFALQPNPTQLKTIQGAP